MFKSRWVLHKATGYCRQYDGTGAQAPLYPEICRKLALVAGSRRTQSGHCCWTLLPCPASGALIWYSRSGH